MRPPPQAPYNRPPGAIHDGTVHPRAGPRHRRYRCARRARQCPGSRSPRRELGLSPIAEQFGNSWRGCFQAASTSGWAAPPAPTNPRCVPCAARPKRPRISRRTFSICRHSSAPGRSKPAYPGSAGCGNGSAIVDTRIEQFRSDARGRVRPALCLRLTFRARTAHSVAANLPQPFQAFRTA